MRTAPSLNFILLIAVVSAVAHLGWENAQAPLYAGYVNFWQHFWMCWSVIPGDVGITLVAYFAVAAWRRNLGWAGAMRLPDALVAGLVATVISVAIERYSLAVGRWGYGPMMPLIPVVQVGVTPVLQMMVVPPLAFRFAGILVKNSV